MNYRHAYHAGNFADVFKHIILVGLITAMKQKEKPFRMIDTHSGIGMYDLLGEESLKTGEAASGIQRVIQHEVHHPWIQEYLKIIKSFNAPDTLRFYPGSPIIAQHLIRGQDKLQLCELHPQDFILLAQNVSGDDHVQVFQKNGYVSLKGFLPPIERRGLVLIDPPFEDRQEFNVIIKALQDGLKRFATGTFAIWYPIKDLQNVDQFYQSLKKLTDSEKTIIEYHTHSSLDPMGLTACGMAILNTPYYFETHLKEAMDEVLMSLKTHENSKIKIYTI